MADRRDPRETSLRALHRHGDGCQHCKRAPFDPSDIALAQKIKDAAKQGAEGARSWDAPTIRNIIAKLETIMHIAEDKLGFNRHEKSERLGVMLSTIQAGICHLPLAAKDKSPEVKKEAEDGLIATARVAKIHGLGCPQLPTKHPLREVVGKERLKEFYEAYQNAYDNTEPPPPARKTAK